MATTTTETKRATIHYKTTAEFDAMLLQRTAEHWRTLRVTIRLREKMHGGQPVSLDAAKAMIKARGLEDVLEARLEAVTDPNDREALAEQVKDEGLCAFHRREGRPGIWMPANNVKAGIKENWSALGYAKAQRGTRGRIAETLFVFGVPAPDSTDPADKHWVRIADDIDGVDTNVAHTRDARGMPVASIKRNEFALRPTLVFDVRISRDGLAEIGDDSLVAMLVHFGEHGIGANRSQGKGTFDVLSVEPIEPASN